MNSDYSFLLGSKESSTLEFKTNYSPHIVKTIAAFLNSEGGTIAIGIQEGEISNNFVGIKDADIIIQRLDNDVKNKLQSQEDVVPYVYYSIVNFFSAKILIVKVSKADTLVYCEGKFYVRISDKSIVASDVDHYLDLLHIEKGALRDVRKYRNEEEIIDRKTSNIFQVGNLPTGSFVYKYMDLEAALLSLNGVNRDVTSQTLRFVEPSWWQDQYEGRFYNAKYERVSKDRKDYPFLYSCCVSTCPEDESAWGIYSYDAKGLKARCVQFKINRKRLIEQLAKNCEKDSAIYLGTVAYKNRSIIDTLHLQDIKKNGTTEENENYNIFFHNFDINKYIQLLLLKRIAYEHEKELRFFIIPPKAEKKVKTQNLNDKKSDALFINIDWLDVLEGVQIDSNCSIYEKSLLKEAIEKLIKQKTNLTEEQRQEVHKSLRIQEMNIHADSRNGSQIEIGVTYNEWRKNM